jgi:hypothetical protein
MSVATDASKFPRLEIVRDCVLLASEYDRNKHVNTADFADKTGWEDFINHVHFPFDGTKGSLSSCLEYAASLQAALMQLTHERQFRVIVSVSDDAPSARFGCTVRFHHVRSDEDSMSENLERYKSEAIMILDARVMNSQSPHLVMQVTSPPSQLCPLTLLLRLLH